ncbi:hypothetical protein [Streptomyces reniochalinae]|uniref:hypothetical protein n=1 Tax=Streptomyces reniochalinae TaxID=2250578 RepID=UPI0011C02387|nr:hypothetical protein [Streptomyces reniochalinae]
MHAGQLSAAARGAARTEAETEITEAVADVRAEMEAAAEATEKAFRSDTVFRDHDGSEGAPKTGPGEGPESPRPRDFGQPPRRPGDDGHGDGGRPLPHRSDGAPHGDADTQHGKPQRQPVQPPGTPGEGQRPQPHQDDKKQQERQEQHRQQQRDERHEAKEREQQRKREKGREGERKHERDEKQDREREQQRKRKRDQQREHERRQEAHGREGNGEDPDRPGRPEDQPPSSGDRTAPHRSDEAIGKHDLYASEGPVPERTDARGNRVAAQPSGQVLPVLPLGAGMALMGLGLAFLALRLRRG